MSLCRARPAIWRLRICCGPWTDSESILAWTSRPLWPLALDGRPVGPTQSVAGGAGLGLWIGYVTILACQLVAAEIFRETQTIETLPSAVSYGCAIAIQRASSSG